MRFMRSLSVVVAVLVGAGVVAAHGEPQDEARVVVAKAIKAMGLEGKAIPKGIRVKAKSSIEVFNKDAELVEVKILQTLTIRLPYQFKEVNEMTVLGETIPFTTIFNGKEGWIEGNGRVREVEPAGLKDYKEMPNVVESTHLITPLLDKKYKLTLIGEANVDGRPATGIRVSRQGFRHLKLYFDKQTHLLVKMERKGLDPLVAMQCQETPLQVVPRNEWTHGPRLRDPAA